jgi:hypothetical protein
LFLSQAFVFCLPPPPTHTHTLPFSLSCALLHRACVVSEASRAIANLLTSFGSHSSIIIDGVPGILHLALSQDAECQYHAAIALRKLAPNLSSHEAIVNADGSCVGVCVWFEARQCPLSPPPPPAPCRETH